MCGAILCGVGAFFVGAGIDDTKAVGKMQENETSCDCVGCGGWRWLGNRV